MAARQARPMARGSSQPRRGGALVAADGFVALAGEHLQIGQGLANVHRFGVGAGKALRKFRGSPGWPRCSERLGLVRFREELLLDALHQIADRQRLLQRGVGRGVAQGLLVDGARSGVKAARLGLGQRQAQRIAGRGVGGIAALERFGGRPTLAGDRRGLSGGCRDRRVGGAIFGGVVSLLGHLSRALGRRPSVIAAPRACGGKRGKKGAPLRPARPSRAFATARRPSRQPLRAKPDS
jgi:hypothetical protein